MFFFLISFITDHARINQLMLVISQSDNLAAVEKELAELFKLLQKTLFKHFRKIFWSFIPPKTIEDLEDGYYNGWERLINKRMLYHSEKSNKAYDWIKFVIENSIRNYFKYGNKNQIKLLDETEDGGFTSNTRAVVLHSQETTKITLFKNEIEFLINIFLEKDSYVVNNPSVRKVFEMRFFDNKKSTDIAQELNIANSTVTKYYNNTITRLREFMKINGFEEF